jgi:hypothetical protein
MMRLGRGRKCNAGKRNCGANEAEKNKEIQRDAQIN